MAEILSNVCCTYCQEDINGLRIQCVECTNFDICLQCFACGAEIGPHKNNHQYKLVYPSPIRLFGGRGNWTGDEELRLLNALFTHGYGRWEVISDIVGTRTPEEVKNEYIARYLEGNIGKATWADAVNIRPVLKDHVSDGEDSDDDDGKSKDDGPLSATAISRLPPLDITPKEAIILEYKPHRDDFNQEYDLEAEELLRILKDDDSGDCSDMEKILKLNIIDMYMRRFRERVKRKRLLRDYQLVAKFFEREYPKKQLTEKQKEFRDKMRVFAQFFTHAEFEQLITGLERERELRYRLSELYKYRSLGLLTQEEIIHYEQHAEFERQLLKQNKSGSSGCATPEQQSKNGNEDDKSSIEEKSMWHQENDSDSNYSNNNSNKSLSKDDHSVSELLKKFLLSSDEVRLCSNLNLEPVHYIQMKQIIMQETSHKRRKLDVNYNNPSVKDAIKHYLTSTGILKGIDGF